MKLNGSMTALVTPFAGPAVDEGALRAFVDWQIAEGTDALIPCGTTGEAPTLSWAEHIRVIEVTAEAARGRVPVIAGTGSGATKEAIDLTKAAKIVGADATLQVAPYYNKPNQEGIYAHFTAIAEATDLPIVLYNIPHRCGVDMSLETIARLSRHPNIVGLKDATADMARVSRQLALAEPGFALLSGDDATALPFNLLGGVGAISVLANVVPRACAEMQEACRHGRWADARALHDRLSPLADALFASPNPGPAKYALSRLGKFGPGLRLPLTPPSADVCARIDAALDRALGAVAA